MDNIKKIIPEIKFYFYSTFRKMTVDGLVISYNFFFWPRPVCQRKVFKTFKNSVQVLYNAMFKVNNNVMCSCYKGAILQNDHFMVICL